jgi:hypothetical protein
MYERSKLRPSKRFIGVWFHTKLKKWRAQFKRHGKPCIIGHYYSERDAAEAFNTAVLAHDGVNGGFLISTINYIEQEQS